MTGPAQSPDEELLAVLFDPPESDDDVDEDDEDDEDEDDESEEEDDDESLEFPAPDAAFELAERLSVL